jgi:hypothetical protein
MSDIAYTQFNDSDLYFERNVITTKDKETGRDVSVYQLLFNYVNSDAPVQKMSADGKRRARFVLQGPRMKSTRPIASRDGRNGSKDYSIFQGYDLEIEEHARWVEINRQITGKIVNELGEKETKAWMKHDKLKSTLPSLVPCLIYQKTTENDDGQLVFEDGSKPSSYMNFFEATTKEGKTFGTRVRIHGSRTDLPKEKWVKLLSENTFEYTPYVSYQRVSYVGGNFRLVTQLDTIIIHEVTPYERQTAADKRQERLGVTQADIERAKRIEAMLSGGSSSTGSETPVSNTPIRSSLAEQYGNDEW